jgi:hypothetical protein
MKKKVFLEKTVALALIAGLIAGLGYASAAFNARAAVGDTGNSSDFWLSLGRDAWSYFQVGVGVDSGTGLAKNNAGSNEFTDWDLALYIQAILDAEKLGILGSSGVWGANDRLDKVLAFLENRPLMWDGLPYLMYSSGTGKNSTDIQQVATDAGCLFVSLKNVEVAKPDLKQRIDNIVYNITNYERRRVSVDILLGQLEKGTREPNVYDYYVTCGFAGFWPERFSNEADAILNLTVSGPKVNYNGVNLPAAKITSEPLLMGIFNFAQPDARLIELSKQAYLAQEARFNVTGKYTAFSEGPTDSGVFAYEWVATNDGRMWVVQTGDSNDVDTDVSMTPIVYFKAAMGFLAIYNTSYAQDMVQFLLKQVPYPGGFGLDVDENGRVIQMAADVSNGLIVSAARYAVSNNVVVPLSYPLASVSVPAITENAAVTVKGDQPLLSTPSSTPAPTPTAHPSPTTTPSVVPDNNQGTVSTVAVGENGFYVVSVVAVVGLLVVLGYRFSKKPLAVQA